MRALDWWKKVYPSTESDELSEAGHFLQEDTPEKNSHNNHIFSARTPRTFKITVRFHLMWGYLPIFPFFCGVMFRVNCLLGKCFLALDSRHIAKLDNLGTSKF